MKYTQLVKAIDAASQRLLGRAAAVVNQALVIRNWLIGAYIIEFEQNGEDRAQYGKRLLVRLSNDLSQRAVKGASPDMLERMRGLFLNYPQIGNVISAPLMRKSCSWPDLKLPTALPEQSPDVAPATISASVTRKSADSRITPMPAR